MTWPNPPVHHPDCDGSPTWQAVCAGCPDVLECMDVDLVCEGEVDYRMALSSSGVSYPRCDKHWEQRLAEQEAINERYPVNAPSDFDPSFANERWDDDF